MRTVQNTSASSNDARHAYVEHICSQHIWHEFATLTFKRPLTSFEQLERAKQMFLGWLHERYYDHAEQLGEAHKTITPKHSSGLGGDTPETREVAAPKDYSGEWIRLPNTSTTELTRQGKWYRQPAPNPELLRYPVGHHGDPITKTRRWWDAGRADYEGDDKGWRVDQVQDYHVRWEGEFVKRWKRYKHLMCPIFILGIERHKSGAWHMHAVIHHRKYADEIRRDRGWDLWFSRFGRASITPVRSQEDVAGYVSKYCCKDYYNVDPRRQAEMILSEFFGQQPKKPYRSSVATALARAPRALPGGGPAAVERLPRTLFPIHRKAPPSPFTSKRDLAPSPSSGGGVNHSQSKLPQPKLKQRGWSPMDQRGANADEARLAAAANSDRIWTIVEEQASRRSRKVEEQASRRSQKDCPIAQLG